MHFYFRLSFIFIFKWTVFFLGIFFLSLMSQCLSAGGNALKYYSSVRLDVRRKESLRDNTGITVKVKVRIREAPQRRESGRQRGALLRRPRDYKK